MENKDITLEEAFSSIDKIIEEISAENVTLEKSFDLYNKGVNLVKICNNKIEKVEKQIEILDKDGALDEF